MAKETRYIIYRCAKFVYIVIYFLYDSSKFIMIFYSFHDQKRNRRSCEASCRETPGCNYWVYVSRKERDTRIAGACYLKENKVSVRSNVKKRTSGPRNCNGNSNGGNGNSNGGNGNSNGGNGGMLSNILRMRVEMFHYTHMLFK